MKLIGSAVVLIFLLASQGTAQSAKTAYPAMAPLSRYLMPRDAEISLARSAARCSPYALFCWSGFLQAAVLQHRLRARWPTAPRLVHRGEVFGISAR